MSFFLHWIYFAGLHMSNHWRTLLFGTWVGFPLLVVVLLAMIRSRWFHYIALLALIAYRLLNYWNFTLAP
jgi:hypothetical protein